MILHGGSVGIIMTTEEGASPLTAREGASLQTTVSFQVSMPEPFAFSRPEEWIRRFERFRVASGLAPKEGDIQISTLIYAMGDQADDTFTLSEEDKKSYPTIKSKFTTSYSDATSSSNEQNSTNNGRRKTNPLRRLSQLSTPSRSTAGMVTYMTK